MAFCQALWATVTSPSQPGPPHFFFPSSVRQFKPPHLDSAQEAPTGVPHVCKDTTDKGNSHSFVSIAERRGGWSQSYDVVPAPCSSIPSTKGRKLKLNGKQKFVHAIGPKQHSFDLSCSLSCTFLPLPCLQIGSSLMLKLLQVEGSLVLPLLSTFHVHLSLESSLYAFCLQSVFSTVGGKNGHLKKLF